MKIAFVSIHNPEDISSWSGLNFFILQALRAQGFDCYTIHGLDAKPNFWMKIKYRYLLLHNKILHYDRTYHYAKQYAKRIESEIIGGTDLIFTTNGMVIPFLKSKIPIVLYTDATFSGISNYYDYFSNVCNETLRTASKIDRLSFDKSKAIIFASHWAAASAYKLSKRNSEKVFVVPFGANINKPPTKELIQKNILSKSLIVKLKLLLVGVDFIRKNIPYAIEVVRLLNQKGIDSELIVTGISTWPLNTDLPYIKNIGYLDKSIKADRDLLDKLYKEAHFFIMPVMQECYGIVFCEAAAYGLPVLATNTGGISTIVNDKETGLLFEDTAKPEAYCDAIIKLQNDPTLYQKMSLKAKERFEQELNWLVAGEKLKAIIEFAVEQHGK